MKGVTAEEFAIFVHDDDPLGAVERSLARLQEDGEHWPDEEVVRGLTYRQLTTVLNGAQEELNDYYELLDDVDIPDEDADWDWEEPDEE